MLDSDASQKSQNRHGSVYVFFNSDREHRQFVKIGLTTRDVETRFREEKGQTNLISWEIGYSATFRDCHMAEAELHHLLDTADIKIIGRSFG